MSIKVFWIVFIMNLYICVTNTIKTSLQGPDPFVPSPVYMAKNSLRRPKIQCSLTSIDYSARYSTRTYPACPVGWNCQKLQRSYLRQGTCRWERSAQTSRVYSESVGHSVASGKVALPTRPCRTVFLERRRNVLRTCCMLGIYGVFREHSSMIL